MPETMLSDRGTNMLSYLIKVVCALSEIKKLNTTAHHLECKGIHTNIKLCRGSKQQATYRKRPGVLEVYCSTQHRLTGENQFYVLFGYCCSPTEADLQPP